jgi:type I restriction enzyme M protein
MLDTETKRRIDTARDILVGKVPDPKSQVEQITIALIYKFMDDMDAEAEELGGHRAFFSGDFARYSWAKLLAPGLGGFEMLALYGEAITKMTENDGLPPLFRDIFKNAYLPYRDPETLKSFLKIINDFTYDHSERLGDAFEYLLSVLGSQGDAGQFRTPRHIIDFMVALLDPQKNEKILDPACGTAGFLISAYKHIIKNSQVQVKNKKESNSSFLIFNSNLTPEERARLLNNIKGYDISPDMVRLSLVNLYLHGFTNPRVAEYDTLTSQDNWHDYADIILANPPFMSPKGGIRPHNRFSVKSSRSEVLFVDYMAEHLTPTGRAAIIVPEGIIFQSQTAYKQLRKMLLDEYLVGVISLPAGVFQPYSGVKTSILWLDKSLAKKTHRLLFARIEADGFDLGAQRRESKQNDLPAALAAMTNYKLQITNGEPFDPAPWPTITLVDKADIAANGDYNLSGERYKKTELKITNYELVKIGEICSFEYGKPLKQENRIQGEYPVFGSNGVVGFHNDFLVEAPYLVVGRKGSAGEVHYSDKSGYPIDTTFYIKLENENRITLKYLFYILKSLDLKNVNVQAGVPGLNRNDAYNIQIPLPPLEVQAEIVAEIESYQQEIENYKLKIKEKEKAIKDRIDKVWGYETE